ncbi:MAG: hypothetical protein ACR2JB_00595 [Bryobacteraceae bacterium]
MPRSRKSPLERAHNALLRNACRYCAADAEVQLARKLWREIQDWHDPVEGVCCWPWTNPFNEQDKRKPLPRSQWCGHCIRITGQDVDYGRGLWNRQAAKTAMKRAYRIILTRSDQVA